MSIKKESIYYNTLITNSTSEPIQARYTENFGRDVLTNPEKYKMSIIRFNIPGSVLPIFVFNEQANYYSMSLTYEGYIGTGYLQYINTRPGTLISEYNYYYVNEYETMVYMINMALLAAFQNLITVLAAAGKTIPAGTRYPPQFTYQSENRSTYMTMTKLGYLANDPFKIWNDPDCNAIEVWCNFNMTRFFSGFQLLKPKQSALTNYIGSTTQLVNKILCIDQGDNHSIFDFSLTLGWEASTTYAVGDIVSYSYSSGDFFISLQNFNTGHEPNGTATDTWWSVYNGFSGFVMSQEYQSLYSWNDAKFISFTTETIPIRAELIRSQGVVGYNERKIVTDYILSTDEGPEIRSEIVYNPTAQYRYIDLISNSPLRQVDIQVYWVDFNNIYKPVYIRPGETITVKILFESIE